SFDEGGQQIGRKGVDGEDVVEPVHRLAARCTWTVDAGIVDDRLERSGRVRLSSKFARLFDAGQITLERRSGARCGAQRLLGPIAVAPMRAHVVAERYQARGGQLSESISRAGDKDAGHATVSPRRALAGPLQNHDRNLPRGLPLVFPEPGRDGDAVGK